MTTGTKVRTKVTIAEPDLYIPAGLIGYVVAEDANFKPWRIEVSIGVGKPVSTFLYAADELEIIE